MIPQQPCHVYPVDVALWVQEERYFVSLGIILHGGDDSEYLLDLTWTDHSSSYLVLCKHTELHHNLLACKTQRMRLDRLLLYVISSGYATLMRWNTSSARQGIGPEPCRLCVYKRDECDVTCVHHLLICMHWPLSGLMST